MPRIAAGAPRAGAGATSVGRGKLVFLLIAITAVAPAALHMSVPSLPLLAGAFAGSAGEVQLVLTVFLAGIAFGQLGYGPVSDRFGRRPVLIAGAAAAD
jgi:DHA1 family bicyclomycin/chloramphenicol resistance-like MFS transporter